MNDDVMSTARPWSPDEAGGAELFRQRCETCHESRLISDDPQSRVPFADWHDLVFSDAGPIVWARNSYEKTGIVPLVHPRGARVPSLRRLTSILPSARPFGPMTGRQFATTTSAPCSFHVGTAASGPSTRRSTST